jgi:Rrf2 family protein
MLKLSKKTVLALEAVVDIAYNARPEPVQAKEITERQGIPQRYLEQVMQHLVHEGILKGVRGPRGGYRLARERRRITVGEIVRLISKLEANHDDENGASELGEKVVRPVINGALDKMLRELDAVTIEDLCRRADAENVAGRNSEKLDFTI